MKRIFALLIALVLIALPALAEPMSYLDYTDDLLEDGSPIYYFPELSLTLPADWNGKVMAMAEEGRTAFYQKASYEKYQAQGLDGGGFLFALGASVNQGFTELPAFEYIGFSEESALNYYLQLPSDYPAFMEDEAVRAEYDAMYAQIDFVVEHAEIYAETAGLIEAGDTTEAAGETAETAGETAEAVGEAAEAAGEAGVTHTPTEVRYYFEHNLMPRYFYEMPEDMLNAIRAQGLGALWESFFSENGVDPAGFDGDIVEHWYASGDATLLQVELPWPVENVQCYRIYLAYDPAAGSAGYFTSESDTLEPDACFICQWTPEGEHVNYGAMNVVSRDADGFGEALAAEAAQVAALAGIEGELAAE